MKRFIKLLFVTICLLLCTSVLVSADSVVFGHNHDCAGEDCKYCEAVSSYQEHLKLILFRCFCVSVSFIFLQTTVNLISCYDDKKQNISLVKNKVKLTA